MLRKTVQTLAGATLAASLIATAGPAAEAANTQTELPFKTFGDEDLRDGYTEK